LKNSSEGFNRNTQIGGTNLKVKSKRKPAIAGPPPKRIGVIGGSGLYQIEGLTKQKRVKVNTPFGKPSDEVLTGEIAGREVVFLPRHGRSHHLLPSELNQRASSWHSSGNGGWGGGDRSSDSSRSGWGGGGDRGGGGGWSRGGGGGRRR
jgi:hypothetical protein